MIAGHVALLSIPLITLLAPVAKEIVVSLVAPSRVDPAYEGDGILLGDTGNYAYVWWWWPSVFTTRWTITQSPVYGDAYHTVSLFVAPKRIAHRFLYRFDSNYSSDFFFVEGDYEQVSQNQQHLDLRRYVYLLPNEYTPGREAKAVYSVDVKKESKELGRNETYGYQTCQFQNLRYFTDFIDMEPEAIDKVYTCHCEYGDVPPCSDNEDCIRSTFSPEFCAEPSGPNFTAVESSYNFFSTVVPTESFVKFEANLTMYFYDPSKLRKHAQYQCTIRDTDTCSFTVPQTLMYSEPQLILAYIHPKAGPFSVTTTLAVQVDIFILENAALTVMYLLIPTFLIKTLFF
jgi:hypothetical protein